MSTIFIKVGLKAIFINKKKQWAQVPLHHRKAQIRHFVKDIIQIWAQNEKQNQGQQETATDAGDDVDIHFCWPQKRWEVNCKVSTYRPCFLYICLHA